MNTETQTPAITAADLINRAAHVPARIQKHFAQQLGEALEIDGSGSGDRPTAEAVAENFVAVWLPKLLAVAPVLNTADLRNGVVPPSHEVLRGYGARVYIIALAASFPALGHKVRALQLTPQSWDVEKWIRAARPWSHAERCAAHFVATVWNYHHAENKRWKFDAVDALSVWDSGNKRAFLAWATNPVWP